MSAAAMVGPRAKRHHVPGLNSFAIGALLRAAFLDVLPEATEAQGAPDVIPVMLALAAARMIYMTDASFIPGLHERCGPVATLRQAVPIASGIGVLAVTKHLRASFRV